MAYFNGTFQIKLVQESKYGAPTVEETMDACLHNKAWVLQVSFH